MDKPKPKNIPDWQWWMMKVASYAKEPKPIKYSLRELCFIWLYSACLYDQFDEDPLIVDTDWDQLTIYLRDNHQFFDAPARWAIPYSCLSTSTVIGVDWVSYGGLGELVRQGCRDYLKQKPKK